MSKDMCCRNRPKFNTDRGLTPNGGVPPGERPGSAPARTAARSPRASTPALLHLFAAGTPPSAAPGGSEGPPADVDELAATLARPSRNSGVVAIELAAAAPAGGVETEASSRPGTAAGPVVEPDARPARLGHRRVTRRVDVPPAVARGNPSTSPTAGTAATGR